MTENQAKKDVKGVFNERNQQKSEEHQECTQQRPRESSPKVILKDHHFVYQRSQDKLENPRQSNNGQKLTTSFFRQPLLIQMIEQSNQNKATRNTLSKVHRP